MLTVIIECHNDEMLLAQTLSVLVAGAVDGLVSDVILADAGSTDGTRRLADAAGCLIVPRAEIADAVRQARGRWLMVLEPGARPQAGWVQAVADYLAAGRNPASFTPSPTFRRPWPQRILKKVGRLEHGLILPRDVAVARLGNGSGLKDLVAGRPMRLTAQIVPAWVLSGRTS